MTNLRNRFRGLYVVAALAGMAPIGSIIASARAANTASTNTADESAPPQAGQLRTAAHTLDKYAPLATCFIKAQGVDPETVRDPSPVLDRYGDATEGVTAYTAILGRAEGAASGAKVGVQVVDWHSDALTGYQQTRSQAIIADISVEVMPAGKQHNHDLSDVPHTSVGQTGGYTPGRSQRGFISTIIAPGRAGITQSADTNRATGKTIYRRSDETGAMPAVDEGQVSPMLLRIHFNALGVRR